MRFPKAVFIFLVIIIVGATVGLDRLIFGDLIFRMENRSGWDSFRWFNFEYHLRKLSGEQADAKRPFVLVVGSSIAEYSVQKDILEAYLKRAGAGSVRVEMAVHASMLPVDLLHYMKRLRSLHPDLIVWITNPADLELERYVPPWEAGPAYSDRAEEHYMKIRFPMRIYYPASFASEQADALTLSERLELYSRGLLYGLRFRDEWLDPLLFNQKASAPGLKSYLYYQGAPIPEGLWREGVTGGCFRFPVSYLRPNGRLDFQVMAGLEKTMGSFRMELYRFRPAGSGASGAASDLPFSPSADSTIAPGDPRRDRFLPRCEIPAGAERIAEYRPKRTGWQSYELPPSPDGRAHPVEGFTGGDGEWIFVLLSHVELDGEAVPFSAGDPVAKGRGVRLPGNFGLAASPLDDTLVRRRSLEDERLSALDTAAYRVDFAKRVEPDGWQKPEYIYLRQLNMLRLAKYYTLWYPFSDAIPQAVAVRSLVRELGEGPELLIINNPENPVTLEEYDDSDWYHGYLDFYRQLSRSSRGHIHFADLHRMGKEQMFLDPHHLTYDGMVRMAPEYAKWIGGILRDKVP